MAAGLMSVILRLLIWKGDILPPRDVCDNLGESPENHAEFKKEKAEEGNGSPL